MVQAVPDILTRIAASKRAALAGRSGDRVALERAAAARTDYRDFAKALTSRKPAIIAEIKRASPSKGSFGTSFDPAAIAKKYASGAAAAISVLTDTEYFQGSMADLESARQAAPVPVLRKDFTLDSFDVIEAAAHGADAILLIAALLGQAEMRHYRELAASYGMAALVEVHDEAELESALGSGAEIVGVNNRNLHTFEVTLETSLRLAEKIPAGIIRVSESGLHSRAAVAQLESAGYHAFLVGEHLMKAAGPELALRGLLA
jgi:indole-3-glycerol phosphate synthase